jgi:hypothetical protein
MRLAKVIEALELQPLFEIVGEAAIQAFWLKQTEINNQKSNCLKSTARVADDNCSIESVRELQT